MSHEDHYRKLERMSASAPINRFYAPSLAVGRGTAELTVPVREDFLHAGGAVHGSVLFKALDDAAFFAAASLVADHFLVTASFTLHFVRPLSEGEMTARGTVVHRSRRLILAEAVLTDGKGRAIARGSGTFLPSDVRLAPELGYA